MADLLDTIAALVTPDRIQKAAAFVGESPASTQKSFSVLVPTILAGLLKLLSSSDTGASQLLSLVTRFGGDGSILNDLGALFGGGTATQTTMSTGRDALQAVFGGKLNGVVDQVASASGVTTSSASSLLNLGAPLVLGVLGREMKARGLNAGGLATLLQGQQGGLEGRIPAALSGLLGLGGPSVTSARTRSAPIEAPAAPSSGWLRWLLPLAVLALVGGWLASSSRSCGQTAEQAKQAAQRTMAKISLPGGGSLEVPEGSFNYNLARFLANPADTAVPKTFVFEDLNYQTGSAGLTPESARTVTDVVAILKAYPTAKVRLEGHTDNTGDPAANKQLSLDRAKSVRDMMVADGIDAGRLDYAGFGQERPIASNDTDDGRAKNRRTELVVVSK
jgi:OmpA-OmpF porin, OOP family